MYTKATAKSIPAGLVDFQVEFFVLDGEIKYIQGGRVHLFKDLDVLSEELLRVDLENHPLALKSIEDLGIIDPQEQLKKYIFCNFGGFDERADVTTDGISIPEYWDCQQRGTCKHEGRICHMPEGINGFITRKEIEIMKLVGKDLSDKEIASRMGISQNTVAVHRTHIEKKIGASSKVGIATFALSNNII